MSGVADILAKNGVIGNSAVFQAYVRIHGYSSRLEAGQYQVPGGADMARSRPCSGTRWPARSR